MCFTGNFALTMMLESATLAPVLSQPSLPLNDPAGLEIAPDCGWELASNLWMAFSCFFNARPRNGESSAVTYLNALAVAAFCFEVDAARMRSVYRVLSAAGLAGSERGQRGLAVDDPVHLGTTVDALRIDLLACQQLQL